MKGSSNKPKDYPVFVSSQKLEFVAKLANTHKQVLTIYNIYNCTVAYNILATHPNLYLVRETKGVINPQCCVDVVIRAQDFRSLSDNVPVAKHRIRVQLQNQPGGGGGSFIGYRDVECVLRLDESSSTAAPSTGSFAEPLGSGAAVGGSSLSSGQQRRFDSPSSTAASGVVVSPGSLPIGVTLTLAAVCIGLLSMPLHSDTGDSAKQNLQQQQQQQQQQQLWWFVDYMTSLSVSHHVKLVAAYALGLLTAALLRC